MKDNLELSKAYYEALERLKYNSDFGVFRGVIEKQLAELEERILFAKFPDSNAREQALANIQAYQMLNMTYVKLFDVAEDQAILIRKTLADRKEKEKEKRAAITGM